MSNVKEKIKAVTSMRLFLPIRLFNCCVVGQSDHDTRDFSRFPLTMAYCMAML